MQKKKILFVKTFSEKKDKIEKFSDEFLYFTFFFFNISNRFLKIFEN